MGEFKESKIKIVVRKSNCEFYKKGDEIYIEGALLNKEKSGNICLTAVNAIYPFIYAARKRVSKDVMGFEELVFRCSDCAEGVEFELIAE
ncbi:TIGR04076 family protein [Clostridium butyricum]